MGGLWVDYNLMSNVPGLFVLGEANFSDHGANRLGASALMQGLADGYFVIPATIASHLARAASRRHTSNTTRSPRPRRTGVDASRSSSPVNGKRTVDDFHRELGLLVWDYCGMERTAARGSSSPASARSAICARSSGPTSACRRSEHVNQDLEKAGRVADFMEFAEVMFNDALTRDESCGGHFRAEHQTEEGEAKRDDDESFAHVAAWEFQGEGEPPPNAASRSPSKT